MAKGQARRPTKNPPILFEKTQRILKEVEKSLGHRLLTYWNSPNGSICNNDVIGLYGILKSMGKCKAMSFFVKSDGGSGQASLRMVNLLRQFSEKTTMLVPLECESAATMLALGADRISSSNKAMTVIAISRSCFENFAGVTSRLTRSSRRWVAFRTGRAVNSHTSRKNASRLTRRIVRASLSKMRT
jgi:ATP-dependent protease ClpP protease subunit